MWSHVAPTEGESPKEVSEGALPKAETLGGSVGAPQGAEIAPGRRLRRLSPANTSVTKSVNLPFTPGATSAIITVVFSTEVDQHV